MRQETRVVVTAVSAVTPIGNDVRESWKNLLAGKHGFATVSRFDPHGLPVTFAAEVKGFAPSAYIPAKQAKRMELFSAYAVAAAMMLLEDAGFKITEKIAPLVGTLIGSGMGGLEIMEISQTRYMKLGPERMSPFFVPLVLSNMAAAQVAIHTGAKGLNISPTSACASGLHAIGMAASEIRLGRMQAAICGGTESTITPLALSGFAAMKALSSRNDDPARSSRPFDKDRDGFVLGEGCGLVLLESLKNAQERGAKILAEVVGFGASCDAFHLTAPPEDGEGMALSMQMAIRDAELAPEEIEHINAHGTSTPLNDIIETRAIKAIFGEHAYKIPVTANKSMIGHALGAAGGIESVFSILSLVEGKLPPIINLEHLDPECDLDYCCGEARSVDIKTVLCNSFGFGGTNGSIIFKKFEE